MPQLPERRPAGEAGVAGGPRCVGDHGAPGQEVPESPSPAPEGQEGGQARGQERHTGLAPRHQGRLASDWGGDYDDYQ